VTPAPRRRDRTLTAEGLERLLAALAPERDQAGVRYEAIRRRLTALFRWRGCAEAEDLADETIDRVAARLAEGAAIFAQDPYSFFHGVALRVLQEYWRRPRRREEALEARHDPSAPAAPEDDAVRLGCLDECLGRLAAPERELVAAYHAADAGGRIRARRVLAERLGLTAGALRIKVFRLRAGLCACVEDCCKASAGETDGAPRA
jgi:hypothetical protein